MLYQKVYLEKDRTLADSGEYTVDITPRDPITVLWVKFQATNGATHNKANTLPECINAIEIIDGADVVYSLDGKQAFALAAYTLGHFPLCMFDEVWDECQTVSVPIFFGRYIGDTDLSFDPTKFRNPQVRVNWNLAAVRAVGATGYVTGSMQLSIIAEVMSGAPSPSGVLSAKERYTYTTSAGGTEYIEMPNDEVWRGLYLRGHKAANPWHWVYDVVKLSCDGGKYTPFDIRGWDVFQRLSLRYPIFHYHHRMAAVDDDVLQCVLRQEEMPSGWSSARNDTVFAYDNAACGQAQVSIYTAGAAQNTKTQFDVDWHGWLPYAVVVIPFGQEQVVGDWFPASAFGSIRLEVRGGVAGAANSVYLQTLRMY